MLYFENLGIQPTTDLKQIKVAFAACLKNNHPENNPKGFQRIKESFDEAIRWAKSQKAAIQTQPNNISNIEETVHVRELNEPQLTPEPDSPAEQYETFFDRLQNGELEIPEPVEAESQQQDNNETLVQLFSDSFYSFQRFYSDTYWEAAYTLIPKIKFETIYRLEHLIVRYISELLEERDDLYFPGQFINLCNGYLNLESKIDMHNFFQEVREMYGESKAIKIKNIIIQPEFVDTKYTQPYLDKILDEDNPHQLVFLIMMIRDSEFDNDLDRMIRYCERGIDEFPKQPFFKQKLLTAQEKLDTLSVEQLLDEYRVLPGINNNDEALFKVGYFYFHLNDINSSIEHLQKAFKINTEHYGVLLYLTKCHIKLNSLHKAFEYAKSAYEIHNKYCFPVKVLLLKIYNDLKSAILNSYDVNGNLECFLKAGIYLEKYIEIKTISLDLLTKYSNNSDILYLLHTYLGDAYSGIKNYEKSLEQYNSALSQDVNTPQNIYDIKTRLFELHCKSGIVENSDELIKYITRTEPDDHIYYLLSKHHALNNKDYISSIEYASMAIDINTNIKYRAWRSEVYFLNKDYLDCITDLIQCNVETLRLVKYVKLLADAYYELEDYSMASENYDKAVSIIHNQMKNNNCNENIEFIYNTYLRCLEANTERLLQSYDDIGFARPRLLQVIQEIEKYYENLPKNLQTRKEQINKLKIISRFYSLRDGDETQDEIEEFTEKNQILLKEISNLEQCNENE